MKLLLIRHGPAGDASEWMSSGRPDRERPLTDDGRDAMQRAAPALAQMVSPLAALATSPYTRAYQTAEIVAATYDGVPIVVLNALASGGDRRDVLDWLREQDSMRSVALVGHNPDLEDLAAWMLAERRDGFLRLKKGGAALITFQDIPFAGGGVLRWLLTPEQMSRMDFRESGIGNRLS